MLNNINNFFLLILLIVIFQSSLFAESAGEHIDDATIASKTKTNLIGNKEVSAGSINVEVSKGIVQLSGFVESKSEKDAALATAKGVKGAKNVLDAMVVMPGSRSAGEAVDDTTISTKLKTALTKAEGLGSATDINTHVRKGRVLLAGFVDNAKIKSAAGEVAKGVKGVKEVHNLIAIK